MPDCEREDNPTTANERWIHHHMRRVVSAHDLFVSIGQCLTCACADEHHGWLCSAGGVEFVWIDADDSGTVSIVGLAGRTAGWRRNGADLRAPR
jgi:hypothetical protein